MENQFRGLRRLIVITVYRPVTRPARAHVHLVGLQNSNDYLCGALCHVHLAGLQNSNDRLCGALSHVRLIGLQNSNDRLFMWRPISRAISWPAE